VDYSDDERGVLLFEAAVSALEKNKGKYRWLKDRENIRISKKRIEEAHQNNAGYVIAGKFLPAGSTCPYRTDSL
jgi:intracellular multiplication protein IcmO